MEFVYHTPQLTLAFVHLDTQVLDAKLKIRVAHIQY